MLSDKTNLRPDALWLNVLDSQATVDTSSPLYNYSSMAAATSPEIYHDDGTKKYAATLVVDVPPAALGRYTIPLDASESFLGDRQSPPMPIPLAELSGATIRIRGCSSNAECDDNDACTQNQCNLALGFCEFPPVGAFDALTECCDPVSGVIAARVDADDCTDDFCTLPNSRGTPSHPPSPNTTPCEDFQSCTVHDHCDGLNSQANGGCISDSVGDFACNTAQDCQALTGTDFPCESGFCFCEELAGAIVWDASPLSSVRSTRRLTFTVVAPATAADSQFTAIAIRPIELENPNPANQPCCPPVNFSAYEAPTCTAAGEGNGCVRWLGPPVTVLESQDNPALGSFMASRLQCTPYYFDWTTLGPITATGPEILPSSTYEISSYSISCQGVEATCPQVSPPVQAQTRRSGDIAMPWNPPATSTQPDPQDVVAVLDKFINRPSAPSKVVAQIQPNVTELNSNINALDTVATIDAFRGRAYPFSGPCACPSTVTCNLTSCSGSNECSGGLCIMTCTGGAHADQPCRNNADCLGGSCPATGFCRDRCGRCSP